MARHDREHVVSFERHAAGEHLEGDGPERVHVRTCIHRIARQLFGRGVGNRADELVRGGEPGGVRGFENGRDAKVHDFVDALAWRELVGDDVGRLQVAMHDAAGVGELERMTELRNDTRHFGHAQPAGCDFIRERSAAEQFHHEEGVAVGVEIEVEDRHDIGMPELCARAALTHEPLARVLRVAGMDDLDRDLVSKQHAARPKHSAHTTGRNGRHDLVPAVEHLTHGEHDYI